MRYSLLCCALALTGLMVSPSPGKAATRPSQASGSLMPACHVKLAATQLLRPSALCTFTAVPHKLEHKLEPRPGHLGSRDTSLAPSKTDAVILRSMEGFTISVLDSSSLHFPNTL